MKYFDDDMDELFNKAGRQYPLKTEPKDWDAVHGALHPEQATPAAPQKKADYRRFLPLLLLLLIPAVYVMIERKEGNDNVKDNTIQNVNKIKTDAPVTSVEVPDTKISSTRDREVTRQPSTVATADKDRDREVKPLSYAPLAENSLSESPEAKRMSGYRNKGGLSGPPQAGKNESGVREKESDVTSMHTLTLSNKVNSSGPEAWNNFPPLTNDISTLNRPSEAIRSGLSLRSLGSNESQSVPPLDKKNPSGKKGLYYGITVAPDLSVIKGQAVKGTGYSAGVIVGYQLNRHWAVEGGFLWSRKKYFTDGKYFDKSGAQIPGNIDVYWLDGGCSMFEFPLVARYDFSVKKNTFFASAGLTSYMMRKEDYRYGATAGIGAPYYEGSRKYNRSGDYLFSNLQLSAGYKFSLSPKMNIRVEPYLKAPLKKIGIGKMPITSAGLSLGITRDLH